MSTEQIIYTSGEASKKLDLKESTFRKYVDVLEGEGYIIQKDNRGYRTFSTHDVMMVEKLMKYAKHDGMTLKKAAKMLVEQSNLPAHEGIEDNSMTSYGLMADLVQASVDKAIQGFEQRIDERESKRDKLLMETLRLMQEQKKENQEVKQMLLEFKQMQQAQIETAATKPTEKKWWEFWK